MIIMIKPKPGYTVQFVRSNHSKEKDSRANKWVVLDVEDVYLNYARKKKNNIIDCEVQDSLVARTAAEPRDEYTVGSWEEVYSSLCSIYWYPNCRQRPQWKSLIQIIHTQNSWKMIHQKSPIQFFHTISICHAFFSIYPYKIRFRNQLFNFSYKIPYGNIRDCGSFYSVFSYPNPQTVFPASFSVCQMIDWTCFRTCYSPFSTTVW